MTSPTDFVLDTQLLRRRFARRAASPGANDFLAREVAARMYERLDYIRFEPERLLDLGCGVGADQAYLARRYPTAQRLALDFALPLLAQMAGQSGLLGRLLGRARRRTGPQPLCADACALPLAHSSVSMIWSNLMLCWLADPALAFREIARVLQAGGLLMFSTLGPDTLKELRAVMPTDQGERVHRFIDMHDLGDALVSAGFADPVMDMQAITLTYTRFDDMLRDLRQASATNASAARPRGLSGRSGWQRARAAYEHLRWEGRLPATIEVVFGHAWRSTPKAVADGRAIIQFHRGKKP